MIQTKVSNSRHMVDPPKGFQHLNSRELLVRQGRGEPSRTTEDGSGEHPKLELSRVACALEGQVSCFTFLDLSCVIWGPEGAVQLRHWSSRLRQWILNACVSRRALFRVKSQVRALLVASVPRAQVLSILGLWQAPSGHPRCSQTWDSFLEGKEQLSPFTTTRWISPSLNILLSQLCQKAAAVTVASVITFIARALAYIEGSKSLRCLPCRSPMLSVSWRRGRVLYFCRVQQEGQLLVLPWASLSLPRSRQGQRLPLRSLTHAQFELRTL